MSAWGGVFRNRTANRLKGSLLKKDVVGHVLKHPYIMLLLSGQHSSGGSSGSSASHLGCGAAKVAQLEGTGLPQELLPSQDVHDFVAIRLLIHGLTIAIIMVLLASLSYS